MVQSPADLGGASSSQWIPGETINEVSNASSAASERTGKRKRRPADSSEAEAGAETKPYECRFCPMKFSKSQALGGHMNRHRQEREQEQLIHAQQLVMQQGFTPIMMAGRSSSPSTSISEHQLPFLQRSLDSTLKSNDPLKGSTSLSSIAATGIQPHFNVSSGFVSSFNWNIYDPLAGSPSRFLTSSDHNLLLKATPALPVEGKTSHWSHARFPYGVESSSSLLPYMSQQPTTKSIFNPLAIQDRALGMTYEKRMQNSNPPILENNLVDEFAPCPLPISGDSSNPQSTIQSRAEGHLADEFGGVGSTKTTTTQVDFLLESPSLQLGPTRGVEPQTSQDFSLSLESGYQFLPPSRLGYEDYAYDGMRMVNSCNPLSDFMPNTTTPLEGIGSILEGDRNMGIATPMNEATFNFSLGLESMMDPMNMVAPPRLEYDSMHAVQEGEASSRSSTSLSLIKFLGDYPSNRLQHVNPQLGSSSLIINSTYRNDETSKKTESKP
ncbi:hypothetical protein O6H91_02G026500 [Diphasiastrum complanatum]|uniref:Uncharacterized protein n=1 Tax=Diphasiastrum complanatum TaxID=34168 RepID=A0ACC2EDY6_DIPCM|nr:hypothetical protein O6H91_02G026500 [Diphasiastrum complanatum]